MLRDLRKYSHLGSPEYFFELFRTINNDCPWSRSDLISLFHNRSVKGQGVFDGCIELAIKINLLEEFQDAYILNNGIKDYLYDVRQLKDRFAFFLLDHIKENDDFHSIFNSKYLNYDIIYRTLQIDNSAFGLKYSNFKQLLIDFEILLEHPTPQFTSFIINSRYKKLFDKAVLPEIKKRKVGIDEFKNSIELQQIHGEQAEQFVLDYERKRLKGKEVDWVAQYCVNDGYDIASYDTESDSYHNRFIEVKSYDGDKPYFFWSKNESKVAKYKKEEYWIYLINRKRITDPNYIPLMIQNPIESVLGNDSWLKEVENYKIVSLKSS